MQNYDNLLKRYDELWKRLNLEDDNGVSIVTRKETEQLRGDMVKFVEEEHPKDQKVKFYPLGLIESLDFMLDDSNLEQSFKFADDK